MAHAANQASAQGSTSPSKPNPKVKSPVKTPSTSSPSQHTGYQGAPVDPLQVSANQQAQAIYAPKVEANASLEASVPTWYARYMADAAARAAQQQAYNAPVLAQQNAAVQNLNAPAAGLDPNSAEYAKSQQAGRGLSALAQFSADNTQANLSAGQQYFAGQQANAARDLPEALTYLKQQGANYASAQAGKAADLYQGMKTTATNQDIAYKTLNLNQANTAADNQFQVANAIQTAKDKKAARVVTRKDTLDRIAAQTKTQQAAADKAAAKQAEKDAATATKKTAAIQKAVGKARVDIKDIQDGWARGGTVPAPTAKDPNATRPATRDELRHALGAKHGGTLVSIMERVRSKQALTPDQVQYLRDKYGSDFRVPREWLNGKAAAPVQRPSNAPGSATGKGQYRPT